MTDEELMDALDGLYAYDTWCVDSGIHDEVLREKVKVEINRDLGEYQLFSARVSRIARELFLTDERIEQGYGLECVASFAQWIDDYMR